MSQKHAQRVLLYGMTYLFSAPIQWENIMQPDVIELDKRKYRFIHSVPLQLLLDLLSAGKPFRLMVLNKAGEARFTIRHKKGHVRFVQINAADDYLCTITEVAEFRFFLKFFEGTPDGSVERALIAAGAVMLGLRAQSEQAERVMNMFLTNSQAVAAQVGGWSWWIEAWPNSTDETTKKKPRKK